MKFVQCREKKEGLYHKKNRMLSSLKIEEKTGIEDRKAMTSPRKGPSLEIK